MKGLPPEIDALMWRIAEEGGPVAQEEFVQRHGRFGPELSRRVRMVAELRAAGKPTAHRPVFTPRPARVATTPRWAVGAAAGLAVLAVGAVAYVAASGSERPSPPAPKPQPVAVVPKVETRPAPLPETPVVRKEPPPVVQKEPEPEPAPTKPKWEEPRDVHLAEVDLSAAIAMVAQGGGLKATLAPGFPKQTVSLDYEGLSTVDILKTMGREYGFTALEEGEGEILVVPAVEGTDASRRVGG